MRAQAAVARLNEEREAKAAETMQRASRAREGAECQGSNPIGHDGPMEYGWRVGGLRFATRLNFWLVNGFWCEHVRETRGRIINAGWRKLHDCYGCGRRRMA